MSPLLLKKQLDIPSESAKYVTVVCAHDHRSASALKLNQTACLYLRFYEKQSLSAVTEARSIASNGGEEMFFVLWCSTQILEVCAKSLLWDSLEPFWQSFLFFCFFYYYYYYFYLSWDQRARLTSIHQDLKVAHSSSAVTVKEGLITPAVFRQYTFSWIYPRRRSDLWKLSMPSVHASFSSDLPRGGELLTKPEWMLLKCREIVYAPNPFLSSLSVRNAGEICLNFFLREIGWFPFCSGVRSVGRHACVNLLRIPSVQPGAVTSWRRGFLLPPSSWKWIISPDFKVENHYFSSCSFITTEANHLRHCQYTDGLSWS